MISSEIASEQKKDSFSTHPVVDSKPTQSMLIQEHINLNKMNKIQTTRPMSIQDYINLDKMNKVQTTRPMLILDHINMSTHFIKSTQYVPLPKSSTLGHIHFHEANKLNTCEKPVDEVWIFDDFS